MAAANQAAPLSGMHHTSLLPPEAPNPQPTDLAEVYGVGVRERGRKRGEREGERESERARERFDQAQTPGYARGM